MTPEATDPMAGAPSIARLKRMLDGYRTDTTNAAMSQRKDRDYFDGPGQLSDTIRAALRARGQPEIYTNRIKPTINGMLGVLSAAQTSPRAYPRNPHPAQENAADVATKALRFMAETNDFGAVKLDCAEEFHIEGTMAAIVEVSDDDIVTTQIPWQDFFYDTLSRRADFSDAKWLGTAKWMYADDVRMLYPERYRALGDPVGGASVADLVKSDEDIEQTTGWVDPKDQRLMLVEVYYREGGEWFRCVFCASGIFEWGKSAYLDDKGRTRCPIEAESCYVDRKRNRYGHVRDMVLIQDEINSRRSRALHLTNSRQIQERETGAAIVDADTARREAARADGVIPSGWQMVPTNDLRGGNLELLQEAKGEIERMGPTPAVLGRAGSASQSGRAKQVAEQAGLTELARSMGRIDDWEQRCYRAMWACARQFKTTPWWVRVTDDVRAPEFIQVNAPDGTNQIAEMDMDIVIATVPNTATLQQEVFADFKELVAGGVDPFSPQFQILIEMSPLANKAEILERIKALKTELSQQSEGQGQHQAAMMAAQMKEMDSKIADLQAGALLKAAQTDKATQETNAAQATAFATLGPVAAAFGIIPDEAGVVNMQARVANAPQPMAMPPVAMGPVDAPQGRPQATP